MAVATLEGVLNSLQTLGEEKLAALDETYAFELAWVRELFATCGTAAAVAISPEKLATPVDSPDEREKAKLSRENEVSGQAKRRGRQTKKAATPRAGSRRMGRKGKAALEEAVDEEPGEEEVQRSEVVQPTPGRPKLQVVPEEDEEAEEEKQETEDVTEAAKVTPRTSERKESGSETDGVVKPTPVSVTPKTAPNPSRQSIPLSCRRSTRSATRRSASQPKASPQGRREASATDITEPADEKNAGAPQLDNIADEIAPASPSAADNCVGGEGAGDRPMDAESVERSEVAEHAEPMGTPVTEPQKELPKYKAMTPVVVVSAGVPDKDVGSRDAQRGCKSPLATGSNRKRSLADTTPLVEINEQLRTASKTVSCRKKRPKTPKDDFGFPMQSTINLLYSQAKEQSGLEFKLDPQPEDMETPRLCPTQQSIFSAKGSALKPVLPRKDGSTELTTSSPVSPPAEDVSMPPEQTVIPAAPSATPLSTQSPEPMATDDVIPATPEADSDLPQPPQSSRKAEESGSTLGSSDSGGAVPAEAASAAAPPPTGTPQSNIVSGVASFVPLVKPQQAAAPPPAAGRAHVKVKALEAANAARREAEAKAAERARRMEAGKQRREAARQAVPAKRAPAPLIAKPPRLAGKPVHGPSRLGQSVASKDAKGAAKPEAHKSAADLQAQRRAQEETERQARQEKMKRMEEQMAKIRREKKEREAARMAERNGGPSNEEKVATAKVTEPQSVAIVSQGIEEVEAGKAVQTPPRPAAVVAAEAVVKEVSYEISPYKSGSDSDEEDDQRRSRKPVPGWAQTVNLVQQLTKQQYVDPDEIFKQKHIKTCSLDDMFRDNPPANPAKVKNLTRRGSSGNWIEDRVTWQEELAYKKAMGFRAFC